jgi:hypothetical protein
MAGVRSAMAWSCFAARDSRAQVLLAGPGGRRPRLEAWKLESDRPIVTIRRIAALCAAFAIGIAGCSLLHHGDSPQQQFLEALNRGNAPQASQIWLQMSPEDRSNLAHGIGVTPKATPEEVNKLLMQHQQEEAEHGGEATGGGEATQSPEIVVPGGAGGSLLDLPSYAPPAASQ